MAQIAFETDHEGKVIYGSFQELLDKVRNGAELKLSLGTGKYNEIVFPQSVRITENCISCIQSLHTAWNMYPPEKSPYKVAFMISTNREDRFVRYNLEGGNLYPRPSHDKNRYDYYRWIVESDHWIQVYQSDNMDKEKERLFIKTLERSGQDVKVSFEHKGVTYILKPYIIVFPKPEKNHGKSALPNVRTYPTLMEEDHPYTDPSLNRRGHLSMAEVFINLSEDVSILQYKQFRNVVSGNKIINRILEILFHAPYTTSNIKQFRLKGSVKWFVRMSKEELRKYQESIEKSTLWQESNHCT